MTTKLIELKSKLGLLEDKKDFNASFIDLRRKISLLPKDYGNDKRKLYALFMENNTFTIARCLKTEVRGSFDFSLYSIENGLTIPNSSEIYGKMGEVIEINGVKMCVFDFVNFLGHNLPFNNEYLFGVIALVNDFLLENPDFIKTIFEEEKTLKLQ